MASRLRDEQGPHQDLPAADCELGRTAAHRRLRGCRLHAVRRFEAIAGQRQVRDGHVGGHGGASRQSVAPQADRIALRQSARRSAPRRRRRHPADCAQRLDGHRARPRARASRQEPHHSEERRGDQIGSAGHLLRHVAGGPREHRWRPGVEPDQGKRSEVRRQHELGSVRISTDQGAVPAPRQQLAHGDRAAGTVEIRGHAARQLREAAAGRGLEGCQGRVARHAADDDTEGVRQHEARRIDPASRRAQLPHRCRHEAVVGEQYRRRRVQAREDRIGLLPGVRTLVLGA